MTGIEKQEPSLTKENWEHHPNKRKNEQLKGHNSSPAHLLSRIASLKEDVKDISDRGKNFAVDLIRYVLAGVPKVDLKELAPSKEKLITWLSHNKFSTVFGIKKRAPNETENHEIDYEGIKDYLDTITERNLRRVPVHNPKRIRRGEAHQLGLRFLNTMKGLIKTVSPEHRITKEDYDRSFQALIMTWGDIGTTKALDFADVEITFFYHDKPTAPTATRYEVSGLDLITPTLHSLPLRRAARYFALPAVNFAKQNNHRYAVGQIHGVPPQYGYLGFDFNDMLYANNSTEAIIMAQARETGLFNEIKNQGQFTNTSAQFQRSGYTTFMGSSRRAPMWMI